MKKLISVLLLIVILLSCCACGKKEAVSTAPTAEPAPETT